MRHSIIASAEINGARVEVAPYRNVCLPVRVKRLNSRLAAFCLLTVSLLPLDAIAQITEPLQPSLVPSPTPPRAPQNKAVLTGWEGDKNT